MQITRIETFVFGTDVRVEFAPITNAPPSTHRIYILRSLQIVAKDWFVPTATMKKPGKAAAKFYFDKHQASIDSFVRT